MASEFRRGGFAATPTPKYAQGGQRYASRLETSVRADGLRVRGRRDAAFRFRIPTVSAAPVVELRAVGLGRTVWFAVGHSRATGDIASLKHRAVPVYGSAASRAVTGNRRRLVAVRYAGCLHRFEEEGRGDAYTRLSTGSGGALRSEHQRPPERVVARSGLGRPRGGRQQEQDERHLEAGVLSHGFSLEDQRYCYHFER